MKKLIQSMLIRICALLDLEVRPAGDLMVRWWTPDYAAGEAEYTPRGLGHTDREKLTDGVLLALFEAGVEAGEIDPDGVDVCEEFTDYASKHGYQPIYELELESGSRYAEADNESVGVLLVPVSG